MAWYQDFLEIWRTSRAISSASGSFDLSPETRVVRKIQEDTGVITASLEE
jgi:hypothetical protein